MNAQDPEKKAADIEANEESKADGTKSEASYQPKEIGGRGGLDPTRYGDWEKAGRCIDF